MKPRGVAHPPEHRTHERDAPHERTLWADLMSGTHLMSGLCGRTAKHSGLPCKNRAMDGQNVCYIHGGKSPQALKKAEERMRDLVHPAVSSLARQIDKDEFAAVRYVLDWAGFKAVEKVESDGRQVIEVEYVGRALDVLRPE